MPLNTLSVLRWVRDPLERNRLYESAMAQLEETGLAEFDEKAFTIRDLVASDMPGNANNEWTEPVANFAAANVYAASASGNGGNIADDTVMCLYGLHLVTVVTAATPTLTVLRFSVGASLRAQVSVYGIFNYNADQNIRNGYLYSPVIITKNQALKIEHYTPTTNTVLQVVYLGLIAEKVGKTIEA